MTISDANGAFLEMADLDYEAAIGTSWRELTPEEFHPDSERHVEQTVGTGSGVPYEKQYYRADGSRFWGLFESRRVEGVGYVEFVIDITERKEAEAERREREDRLDAFVTSTSEVVYRMTPDWTEMHYLDGKDFVVDTEERRGTWLEEYVPENERERVTAAIEDAIETKSTFDLEHQVVQADGTRGWVHARAVPVLDDDGEIAEWFGTSTDITERERRTRALKERTAELEEVRNRLRVAAEAGSVGLWTVDVDEDRLIGDTYVAECYGVDPDRAAEGAPVEEFVASVHDDDTERILRDVDNAITETGRFETEFRVQNAEGDDLWLVSRGTVEYDDDGTPRKLHGAISNITEQKRRERREQFLLALSDAIRSISDPVEIQREAARVLCEELGADRVQYGEVLDDENTNVVRADYHRDDMESLAGEHRLDSYGEYITDGFRAGETLVVDDLETSPTLSEASLETCRRAQIHAWVGVPLVKDGSLEAFLSVTESTAREWTDTEVAMVEETAERTWGAVERAHAKQNLRESEERYRTLFESIDEGFFIVEVIFDEDDDPVDYRFLETNPAFESQTGLTDAEGERMRDLEPNHEDHWFEIYGRIARTGEPERFQNEAKYIGDRWYNVYAFRIGDADERKVAVLFNDISELKRTQRALERLTGASRELIDVDTETLYVRVADLTVDVLDVEYAALWRYNEADGDLTEATSALNAGSETDAVRHPDDISDHVWQAFVGDEIAVSNDLFAEGTARDGATLRSRLLLPLGRHGVVCVGSLQSHAFDERVVGLAETLGATLETAWDRAEGEHRLQAQNDELQRLDRLNSLIRGIDQVLVGADTREEIDEAVCEQLARSDLYESAWLAAYDGETDTLRPRAWSGIDSRYLDDRTVTVGDASGDDPLVAAHRTHEIQVVSDVAVDARVASWREAALERGARSCITVPLVYEGSMYGILTVYGRTPRPDDRETEVIAELGQTIAHTIHAAETQTTRRPDSVVELTFRTRNAETPLARLSRETDCDITVEGLVPSTATDELLVFFTASGIASDALSAAGERILAIDDLTCLDEREDESLFRARLTDQLLVSVPVARHAIVRSVAVEAGTVTVVADLPETGAVSEFLDELQRDLPDLELLARTTRTRPLETQSSLRMTLEDRLTPRQLEVLQTAYESGYFESPRVQTGTDLAAVLDISQATFTYHLRESQRRLCALVFESA
ncbi:bacterio-opsin activator domain-containing protein [Haloferax sp. ATB1]|uniref:bacterio-opsin activator domain-containing protein n=1 Tax=Haloferax sp. ATB1 TaxID=1508454 RepID=UPI001F518FE1|nr:bacterio-opsin activator domain-containing protein [Haloferax sp. ATB1]